MTDLELFQKGKSGLPLVAPWTSFGRMWKAEDVYLPGDHRPERAPMPMPHEPFRPITGACQVCDHIMHRTALTEFTDDGDTLYLCVDQVACEARRAGKAEQMTTLADLERRVAALERLHADPEPDESLASLKTAWDTATERGVTTRPDKGAA